MKSLLTKLFTLVCMMVVVASQQAAAFTQNDFGCQDQGGVSGTCFYNPADMCQATGSSAAAATDTSTTTAPVNSSSTPKNGQSLGGVAGTGFTQDDINKAKAAGHGGSFGGASDFLATTYGPPWDSVEGGGTTSTGLPLSGPDNGHGRPRYEIAVDPSVIPYGSLVTVWPNAVNWHGAFLAADTGGAIVGHHVDVYDWSGDGTKDTFSRTGAKVEPYTGSLADSGTPAGTAASSDTSGTASCCSAASSVTPGSGAPDGTTFPNLDPSAMADAIDKWVVQQNPNTTLKGLGATIVASAKNSNVNPFLLAAIPKKESSMADPNDFNVSHGNNAYGRSAAPGQPSFLGARAWYKWSSMKASVDYTAPENQGSKVGDMASYLRNSGAYTAALDSNDLTKFFMTYAPPSDGNATVQYIADVKSWIGQMVALAGGAAPATPAATTTASTTSSGSTCCPPSGSASGSTTTTATGTTDKPDFIDLSGPPVNASRMGNGKLSKINVLLIHYTEGNQEGAALANYFVNNSGGLGVQFNIGVTGKVYQYFPLNDMQLAWQAFGISTHSIGIEITGHDGESLLNNQPQFDSVVKTVKYLCGYYNIPCSDPKGDITNSTEPNSQGLLGHSEAPGNDHSDPDTKILPPDPPGTYINLSTGKLWSSADRSNSSVHAYMIKLRTALGYDPTPGSSGTSTPTGSTSSTTSCPAPAPITTSPGGLIWPFATKDPSQYNRVDQGWDLAGQAGENIYAIAPGTVDTYIPNPGRGLFGNDYPVEHLDSSIGGPTDWVYYGHVHILPGLKGKHVTAGQLIAHANRYAGENGSGVQAGWLEIGFAKPGTDAPTDGPPFPTAAGTKMKDLLQGAQPGPGGS